MAVSSRARPDRLLVTCEHGGARVPAWLAPHFRGRSAWLRSHRGVDLGALPVARALARRTGAPLIAATTSRLVVDLNRSPHHPRLLSEVTRALPAELRARILRRHYRPHREAVEREIARLAGGGARVVHVAVHSFTPVLDGVRRETDVGLLYDPARRPERVFCARWQRALRDLAPELRLRRNFPYRGAADGLTTALRRRHPASHYLGIELELDQGALLGPPAAARRLRRAVVESLRAVLGECARARGALRGGGGFR